MRATDLPTRDLLSINELTVEFSGRRRKQKVLRAVDGISFAIPKGSTVALVGESGSGKSTIGNAILGLVHASSGSVDFRGERIIDSSHIRRDLISSRIQVVFQDPYGSLNPSRTIGQTMIEPLLVKGRHFDGDKDVAVAEALKSVGLAPDVASRYPFQFSGGQRQRIAIARAIITEPDLIICDEPVSSLDLSVQAQILNLLSELQQQRGLSYLFISHDLAVVRRFADSVVILYQGRVVESGAIAEVATTPHHPYTAALLSAAPVPDPVIQRLRRETRRSHSLKTGETVAENSACQYAPRCPLAIDICSSQRPELRPTPAGTLAACHRSEEVGDGALNFI